MSHRDRTDLGTHLSLGENRGSYVRATDRHLSLRSFRDNYSQSTLPLWNEFVNEPAKTLYGGEAELDAGLMERATGQESAQIPSPRSIPSGKRRSGARLELAVDAKGDRLGVTLCADECGGERCNAAVVHDGGGAEAIALSSKQLRP